jgi:hypothetical protein
VGCRDRGCDALANTRDALGDMPCPTVDPVTVIGQPQTYSEQKLDMSTKFYIAELSSPLRFHRCSIRSQSRQPEPIITRHSIQHLQLVTICAAVRIDCSAGALTRSCTFGLQNAGLSFRKACHRLSQDCPLIAPSFAHMPCPAHRPTTTPVRQATRPIFASLP